MYVVLANEVADVDSAEFEKIGRFSSDVLAMPCIDLSLGLKGMRTSSMDRVEDCQNSIFVTFEPPADDDVYLEAIITDPFEPGILYRRDDQDYVELRYSHDIGLLTLIVYFLVAVEDCEFGIYDGVNYTRAKDLSLLWKMGFIRRV